MTTKLLTGLFCLVLLYIAFVVVDSPRIVGKIVGIVETIEDERVGIRNEDGNLEYIRKFDTSIGEKVNITKYKTPITGRVKYSFFTVSIATLEQ